jgi:hypothetical protein
LIPEHPRAVERVVTLATLGGESTEARGRKILSRRRYA